MEFSGWGQQPRGAWGEQPSRRAAGTSENQEHGCDLSMLAEDLAILQTPDRETLQGRCQFPQWIVPRVDDLTEACFLLRSQHEVPLPYTHRLRTTSPHWLGCAAPRPVFGRLQQRLERR